ncbi:ABC transporter ATP-binding protein [Amycolatopsis sp. CA-230715]|uniref:ABC transporter ATP-binding protein n=1 Tax=Amycolatopsis sp. CA-230715 TaxID=2745196 RepID=UPI001C01024D|nr:ABC transporter ATP-binding protein [Amycolatopsis sp. CA-230715]QWF82046.1 Daunorubicin/doxorubicin resistance ATP-binding protein DrrA [Amycolatopsis sp. CA-230715]
MTPEEPVVRFEEVVKRYPGPAGEVVVLDGVRLTVGRGEVFGLLGPNGAGKTTSIEIMVGLRKADSGLVRVLGLDPVARRDEIRARVAIQPQQAAVFEHQTVIELLSTWASFYPEPDSPETVLAKMGLSESRDKKIAKLSGGQKQRVLVGLALVSRPRLLVLDEPSTGMDPNARQELWDGLRAYRDEGGTVLLSTHSMEEAQLLCDRVAVLHRGRTVACGPPGELIREHAPDREIRFTVRADRDLSVVEPLTTAWEIAPGGEGETSVRLRTTDPDAVFAVIAGTLGARRIEVTDAGLEGVFRRLTGHDFAEADDETGVRGAA